MAATAIFLKNHSYSTIIGSSRAPYINALAREMQPSPAGSTSAPGIFSQGRSWKAYEESMPSDCDKSNSGEYAARHNPPLYFTSLGGCAANDVPYTRLQADLASNTLPAFSFITPNLIDDMHDGTIADGDTWLASHLPAILSSSEYRTGSTAVFRHLGRRRGRHEQ